MEKGIIVGLNVDSNKDFIESMKELKNLAGACHIDIIEELIQNKSAPSIKFYIGKGKDRRMERVYGHNLHCKRIAEKYGVKSVSGTISSKTRADYFPGALPIRIKLVAEKQTGKLISAQIIGGEEVTQRINAMSFAIQKGMTAQELAKAETCYAPPVSETWEPTVLVAELLLRKLK